MTADRRRELVVAGHRGDVAALRAALTDPDAQLRRLALSGLARAARLDGDDLRRALIDPDAGVRRRAAELAAEDDAVDLLATLDDADPSVVEVAAWACGERAGTPAVVERLVRLADEHDDPLCRESAIAALGALGDPAGRDAVLRATGDKPAIRRRAVVALAAFDGPDVEAALRRALEDRDWQVRQAAEQLLDVGPGPSAT